MARTMMADMGLQVKPFIVYSGNRPAVELADGATWIGVQLYVEGGQGPDDLRRLAAIWAPVVRAVPVVLICQAYDRNSTYHGDLAALQPVYAEITRNWQLDGINVKALLWFSDGRPGGTRSHEEMRPWHVEIASAAGTP